MRRFRYRLEAVLGHRRGILRDRQRDLAAAQSKVVGLEKALASVEMCRRDCQEQARQVAMGALDRMEMLRLRSYGNSLWLRILSGARELAGLRAMAEDRRGAVVRAMQDVRALETHREKVQVQWAREAARAEQRALDEVKRSCGVTALPGQTGGQVRGCG